MNWYRRAKAHAKKWGGEKDEIACTLTACLNCGQEDSIDNMTVDEEGAYCNVVCQNEFYEREEE